MNVLQKLSLLESDFRKLLERLVDCREEIKDSFPPDDSQKTKTGKGKKNGR